MSAAAGTAAASISSSSRAVPMVTAGVGSSSNSAGRLMVAVVAAAAGLVEEGDELSAMTCHICFDESQAPTVFFVPCRHSACAECVQKLRVATVYKADKGVHCPYCRQLIESYSKTPPPKQISHGQQLQALPPHLAQPAFRFVVGAGGPRGRARVPSWYGRLGVVSVGGLNEWTPPPNVTGAEGSGFKTTRPEESQEAYSGPPLKSSDNIVAMAFQPAGCRHLSQNLICSTGARRQKVGKQVMEALAPHARKLATHFSGNYVLQRILDYASQNRGDLVRGECGFTVMVRALCAEKGIPTIAKDNKGTFVVQKMVSCIQNPRELSLVMQSIEGGVRGMAFDNCATFSLERIVEMCIMSISQPAGRHPVAPAHAAARCLARIVWELCPDRTKAVAVAIHPINSAILAESLRWCYPEPEARSVAMGLAGSAGDMLRCKPGVRFLQALLSLDVADIAERLISSLAGRFAELAVDSTHGASKLVFACLATPCVSSDARVKITDELISASAWESSGHANPLRGEGSRELLGFGLCLLPDSVLQPRVSWLKSLLQSSKELNVSQLMQLVAKMRKAYVIAPPPPLSSMATATVTDTVTIPTAAGAEGGDVADGASQPSAPTAAAATCSVVAATAVPSSQTQVVASQQQTPSNPSPNEKYTDNFPPLAPTALASAGVQMSETVGRPAGSSQSKAPVGVGVGVGAPHSLNLGGDQAVQKQLPGKKGESDAAPQAPPRKGKNKGAKKTQPPVSGNGSSSFHALPANAAPAAAAAAPAMLEASSPVSAGVSVCQTTSDRGSTCAPPDCVESFHGAVATSERQHGLPAAVSNDLLLQQQHQHQQLVTAGSEASSTIRLTEDGSSSSTWDGSSSSEGGGDNGESTGSLEGDVAGARGSSRVEGGAAATCQEIPSARHRLSLSAADEEASAALVSMWTVRCGVCQVNAASVVLLNCCHLAACSLCASPSAMSPLTTCPMCHHPVAMALQVKTVGVPPAFMHHSSSPTSSASSAQQPVADVPLGTGSSSGGVGGGGGGGGGGFSGGSDGGASSNGSGVTSTALASRDSSSSDCFGEAYSPWTGPLAAVPPALPVAAGSAAVAHSDAGMPSAGWSPLRALNLGPTVTPPPPAIPPGSAFVTAAGGTSLYSSAFESLGRSMEGASVDAAPSLAAGFHAAGEAGEYFHNLAEELVDDPGPAEHDAIAAPRSPAAAAVGVESAAVSTADMALVAPPPASSPQLMMEGAAAAAAGAAAPHIGGPRGLWASAAPPVSDFAAAPSIPAGADAMALFGSMVPVESGNMLLRHLMHHHQPQSVAQQGVHGGVFNHHHVLAGSTYLALADANVQHALHGQSHHHQQHHHGQQQHQQQQQQQGTDQIALPGIPGSSLATASWAPSPDTGYPTHGSHGSHTPAGAHPDRVHFYPGIHSAKSSPALGPLGLGLAGSNIRAVGGNSISSSSSSSAPASPLKLEMAHSLSPAVPRPRPRPYCPPGLF